MKMNTECNDSYAWSTYISSILHFDRSQHCKPFSIHGIKIWQYSVVVDSLLIVASIVGALFLFHDCLCSALSPVKF